nr:MLO-like protein 4 isoform X2 [Quercus suber]
MRQPPWRMLINFSKFLLVASLNLNWRMSELRCSSGFVGLSQKMEEEPREGRSLAETPTWAVATVITVMVSFGFFFHGSLKWSGKWLAKSKRKPLLAALERIKEELMLFGLLSLLMGHWIAFVAKICGSNHLNDFIVREQVKAGGHNYCPEGHESFASHESLEQLHRLVFVLGITHVIYSFIAIALAMIKIYSWRTWENEAKSMAIQSLQALFQPPVLEFYKSS